MLTSAGRVSAVQRRSFVVTQGVAWEPADLTGGPIDEVFAALRRSFSDIRIERLSVTHPTDDNNVWFITRASVGTELQIDSMPNGAPPFLLESDSDGARTEDASEAIQRLTEWLHA
jgi:hypothetical protein